jgi:rhamnose utilization protein RhaD (predicted bifunctional aldolase and dehydrogenase)
MSDVLDELVEMSRCLGDLATDYAIIGEGNTSTHVGDGSFWVKASGTQLAAASRDSFVRVRSAPILKALAEARLDDAGVTDLLKTAPVEGDRKPSIETFLHALCLQLEGVRFVGHTHPTVAVGLLCSKQSRELFTGSLFPDQIVVTGPEYAYVPYTDPGLPLALAVQSAVRDVIDRTRRIPKVILMENHGVIALGSTPRDVLNATQMLVKTCRILAQTLTAGGPRFLSKSHVQRIDQRPDELTRRRDFA